jgi:GNAT superfamily N-acetyltransferase
MGVRRLADPEELARTADGVPWLRWGVDLREADTWLDDVSAAVAVIRTRRPYGTSLFAVGDPRGAVRLAVALAPDLDLRWVTLPRAAVMPSGSAFGPRFGPVAQGVGWEWLWTTTMPPVTPAEQRVVELDGTSPSIRAELVAFLAANSPRHSAEPDDDRVRRWLGVRTVDGELLACVALYEAVPGVDLMASVAVAQAARGQGLGLAVAAAATRRSLRERPPVSTVDLYSDNDAARSLYRRLGYQLDQAFTSYPVA